MGCQSNKVKSSDSTIFQLAIDFFTMDYYLQPDFVITRYGNRHIWGIEEWILYHRWIGKIVSHSKWKQNCKYLVMPKVGHFWTPGLPALMQWWFNGALSAP